jgi:hypothetical protein
MLRRLRQIADGLIFGVNRSCEIGEPQNGPHKYIMRAAFPDRPSKFDLPDINQKTEKRLLSPSSYFKAGGSLTVWGGGIWSRAD